MQIMYNLSKLLSVVLMSGMAISSSLATETVPFDSDRWELDAEKVEIVEHEGEQGVLLLKEGHAYLKDAGFKNGTITYDIKFPPGLAFVGPMVRAQSIGDFERFYMRLHLSGKPDAVQYTPYFNRMTGWQLYPQYAGETVFKFDEWNKVKAVFLDEKAEFYVNDMEKPVLSVDRLRGEQAEGGVGIVMERIPFLELTPVFIKDFSVEKSDTVELNGEYASKEAVAAGTVMNWEVSSLFDERDFAGATNLNSKDLGREWQSVQAEHTGLVNFSRFYEAETLLETGKKTGKNAVIARIKIQSDQKQIKKLSFGFSDNVWVFVNGQIVFSASDQWSSRDYRFLGTVGYWDHLFLALEEGENEVLFLVSESMPDDGWAIQAMFDDMSGIELN